MRFNLVFGALLLALLTGCTRRQATQSASAPLPVRVRSAQQVEQPETINVSGSVTSPDAPADVPFLVAGRVVRVLPHEGEAVHKGQVLARLDPTEYSLAVDAAVAQVSAAKVGLERAEDEYRRMKMLYEAKSLAPNDFQKFRAAYEAAKQQVAQASAAERGARKRLSDTTLIAPLDGYLSRRAVEPGNVAAPGMPLFQIVKLNPIEVVVGVPETDVHLVRTGQPAQVQIPALSGETFAGTVRTINVSADPATRTYSVHIAVPNPQHKLRVGMVAEVQIQGDKMVKAITLPGDAIVRDPQGATMVYVYYPEQKRVFAKRVDVGSVFGQEVRIRSGITTEQSVVIAGQQSLRDGMLVEPVTDARSPLAVSGAESR